VLAIETAVLEHAEAALDPQVASAARARKLALAKAGTRGRVAERELIDLVVANAGELADLRGLGGGKLQRPVHGKTVGAFGRYLDRVLAVPMLRNGIEIAATRDEKVVAIAAGRVALVTELPEYGGAVIVEHADGQLSLTARLWKIGVAVGDTVTAGQALGSAAPKAIDDGLGPTIYFELRHGERPVDPEPLLARPRSQAPRVRARENVSDDAEPTDVVLDDAAAAELLEAPAG
jgi:septal ring factor EnvC (AmiA/AmiB activator)